MAYYGGRYGNDGYGGFPPYVPVAARRARALAAAARFAKSQSKQARTLSPVAPIQGNKIARSFWGQAWCENLESYSDYAHRLPRGRSYVRHGCVADLQIGRGRVTALVSGSDLYRITIGIKSLPDARWEAVTGKCAGQIDSLVALLRGNLPDEIMEVVTDRDSGLFPAPREIDLDCSCPDWADMCKHVAAALYGVGARLDQKPELLFELRGVDHLDLLGGAASAATRGVAVPAGAKVLDRSDLSSVFGIEIDTAPRRAPASAPAQAAPTGAARARQRGNATAPIASTEWRFGAPGGQATTQAQRQALRQARRLQGQYMGTMRLLPREAKLAVKAMREKEGVAVAIKLARQLARGERASRARRAAKITEVATRLDTAVPSPRPERARRPNRGRPPRQPKPRRSTLAALVADAVRRAFGGGPLRRRRSRGGS